MPGLLAGAGLDGEGGGAREGNALVGTALRHQAWFWVTARMNPSVVKAIGGIAEDAWQPIAYPNAVWEAEDRPDAEPGAGQWVSDAEVAEVAFTAFTGRRKAENVRCRLVVRRVSRHQPLAGDGTAQGELFAAYRHHAFITNSTLGLVEADERHRDHAVIERVIAELKGGPLAHLPSGQYAANAAWVALAVTAFNLAGPPRSPQGIPMGHRASPHHRHPRRCRLDRPASRPPPPDLLAMGGKLAVAVERRDRATAPATT